MEITITNGLNLSATPEVSAVGANEERSSFLVMSSIVAPEHRADKRAPVDMICVIDRSGSMSGDRIDKAKATVEFVIENLQHEDRLGVVTYDDNVSYHFPLTAMDAEGKQAAKAAVERISLGGSTNLCGGLVEAIHQMRKREGHKNEVASVLLFTDGQANIGYTSADDIIKATVNDSFFQAMSLGPLGGLRGGYGAPILQQSLFRSPTAGVNSAVQSNAYRLPVAAYPQQQQQQLPPQLATPAVVQAQNPASFTGVGEVTEQEPYKKKKKSEDEGAEVPLPCTINTFGFGSDHDAALLKKIADHGQGMYYYIDTPKTIAEAYADCLGGLLSVVAQDIKVRFEVPQGATGVKINRVVTKFKCTEVKLGRVYELSLGDIQSEERRDILVDVLVPATGVVETEVPVLKTTVTYTNVITGERGSSASRTATVNRPVAPSGETRDYAVDKQFNRLLAAEAMEQSNEAARGGDLARAREILSQARSRIQESVSRDDTFCKSLVEDLVRCEGGLASQQSYQTGGSKMLSNQMQAHYVQRSSNVGWAAQCAYQTSSRGQMQQAFSKHS